MNICLLGNYFHCVRVHTLLFFAWNKFSMTIFIKNILRIYIYYVCVCVLMLLMDLCFLKYFFVCCINSNEETVNGLSC